MTLDYTTKGEVHISMIKYIKDMIDALPKEFKTMATMPAFDDLFQICDQAKARLLPEEMAMEFYHCALITSLMNHRCPYSW